MNYDELERLNSLREKGAITEEEFQREKERILNSQTQNQHEEVKYGQVQNGYGQQYAGDQQLKSKLAAGLFGIFLGAFGVHNFYLGYTNKGIAQVLISVLSCGALSVISGIWGLIEGIMILAGEIKTDAKGNPLKD